jgi:hypothetical protein
MRRGLRAAEVVVLPYQQPAQALVIPPPALVQRIGGVRVDY